MMERLSTDWCRVSAGSVHGVCVAVTVTLIILLMVSLTGVHIQIDGRHAGRFLSLCCVQDGYRGYGTECGCHLKLMLSVRVRF